MYIINPYSKEDYVFKLIVGHSYISNMKTNYAIGWRRNVSKPVRMTSNTGYRLALCRKLIVRGIIT